jgi:hypothetical protein
VNAINNRGRRALHLAIDEPRKTKGRILLDR